jgi:transcriptional regulator with XRE-family HTH domain
MTPGDKLKRLRMERGFKQEEIAQALYFSNRTISNWENNLRTISAENLKKIADFFQVPISYFYQDTDAVMPDQRVYQHIRLKQISLNDAYFFILLGLMIFQVTLIFFPIGPRLNWVVIQLLFWLGFILVSYLRYTHLDRQRTKDYVLPLEQKAQYFTSLNKQQRHRIFITMVGTYGGLLLSTFVFYAGVYTLFNLFEESPILLAFIVLYAVLMIVGHIIGFLVVLRRGIPQEKLDYDKHTYDFGMYLHRAFVTLHYVAIIAFFMLMSGLPLGDEHLDLVWLVILVGLFKVIYLRQFLDRVSRFFASYQLHPLVSIHKS